MMEWVFSFATEETPELGEVGGKAMSLIHSTQHDLPVPTGFVLTVAFFEPWLEQIQATAEWKQVLESSPQELQQNCKAVKALCEDLRMDRAHRDALAQAVTLLDVNGRPSRFAVRSSSPEEDLEQLSFAGGYETVLGVGERDVEDAVRRCFASAFDDRVFLYKQEHGLAVDRPRIAVIVQQQIPAETAGVAFSLNPVNNCYDEAVVNANFGLGESVVAGQISPDSYLVDKVTRTILERKVGKKETSVWLATDGGTVQAPAPFRTELCLSDGQVLELADLVLQVEERYRKPMDIEWAFAGENGARQQLYLLQARPITAYVPLPESMLTAPGEPKRLYGDVTLAKWGMGAPLSVMGTDYMQIANAAMLRLTMGKDVSQEVIRQTRLAIEGRTYANVSNSLKLEGKKRVVTLFREMDDLSAEIIENIDEAEYVPDKLPPVLKGLMFKMVRSNLGTLWKGLQAYRHPAEFGPMYLESIEKLRADLAQIAERGDELTIREFAQRTMERMMLDADLFFPVIFAAVIAKSRIGSLFKDDREEVRDRVLYLERALPHNVTIAMGLAMYDLSRFPEIAQSRSREAFVTGLRERSLSREFLEAWDAFMAEYGFRTPMEMDPATSRFYERPVQFYEQLRTLALNTDASNSPQAIFDSARTEREESYQELLQVAQQKGKRKAKQFARNYQILVELGGFRETPKYCFILITDLFRRRVLEAAQSLVDAGRLDQVQQVFELTIDELDRALVDPALDLRALAEENTRFLKKLQHVLEFPRLIDSRGKILRAPRKEAGEGELAGEPISPGVVQGKVKVLHRPDEKPVLPGEILVTRATDPGWTPLFLNAAGIVLEVGGMLQHGALVAREYGKPCVSGLESATELLHDGQVIELDGANGIIRLLSQSGSAH
jgi:pyruvate,water dikinase